MRFSQYTCKLISPVNTLFIFFSNVSYMSANIFNKPPCLSLLFSATICRTMTLSVTFANVITVMAVATCHRFYHHVSFWKTTPTFDWSVPCAELGV